MSETQVAERPVARTVYNGVTLTSAMTPEERHNAIAKSIGAPPTQAQHVTFSGPLGHPHVVVPDAEVGTIGGKAPPPSPKALEAQNKQAPQEKIAAFDAEMRAQGKQLSQGSGTPPTDPSAVDTAGIEKLKAAYTEQMEQYERMSPSSFRDKNIERIRTQFHEELEEFMQGRKLGEKRAEFKARRDGTAVTPAKSGAPAPSGKPTWQQHVADGQVDLDKITVADTSGYTLERFRPNQTLRAEAFDMLKNAKAAGFSQAQINAYLRAEAAKLGWIKA